ncbi:HD domain-containing phosphohydrolase [Devosia sp.]|uniref:HD domain-containing phosphohydrolase n=1 Tax=Devosia sp. TaxID=1871048 RepID=UPI003A8F79F2
MRLMVVEDNRTNLLVLSGILKKFPDCEVESFLDPLEAIARAEAELFDLIVVDYMMPNLDGRGFISRLRERDDYRHIPMVMITADGNRQTRIEAITSGATDFLNKPVDPVELRARIGNLLVMRQQQRELADRTTWLASEVERATRSLVRQEEDVIWRLTRALEYRDSDTGEHTSRVANVARLIAEALGMSEAACRTIYLAAPLHDIGKVAVPDALLAKPGRLSDEELDLMKMHVPVGEAILAGANSELVRVASLIASSHHERWDGTGYPNRTAGEAIPIEGRITAVADVFDALCSERPYKPAWPIADARQEIQNSAGTQFDPACVAAFERQWSQIEALYSQAATADHGMAKALAVLSA